MGLFNLCGRVSLISFTLLKFSDYLYEHYFTFSYICFVFFRGLVIFHLGDMPTLLILSLFWCLIQVLRLLALGGNGLMKESLVPWELSL